MSIPLHNRSAFSFCSALTRPADLVRFAVRHRLPAIALTDLHGLYAAIPFLQLCERAGIKPIIGTEFRIAGGVELTLLAQGKQGYGALCHLVSLYQLRDQPLHLQDIREQADDLICLIGELAPAKEIGTARDTGKQSTVHRRQVLVDSKQSTVGSSASPTSRLRSVISTLRDAFAGRLYVELTIHQRDDVFTARRRAAVADRANVPVVATSASRCMYPEEASILQALSSIGTLTLYEQPHPDKPVGDYRLRSPAEMQKRFARRPDALANTFTIAERCCFSLDLDRNRFPAFTSPDGRTAMQHLRELSLAGCRRRYVDEPPLSGIGGPRPTLARAIERLERELSIIDQVHYAEYFLVFHEIVQYCRRRGIATLARGSAADSLVCYVLGVSHACPFRFDLPFDRFVNPERARFSKMADIDLDLPWDQREKVIRWVYDRWGHDRVAMIGSPHTFHGRAAVAELGKVFGLPAHEVHRVTKLLPRVQATKLRESIAASPETRHLPIQEEPFRTILQMAGALEGLPRHWSMHPCGMVVSPEPLTHLVPVQSSPRDLLVAQYDMDVIEDLGFVKIDLLGQAGLSVLRDSVADIERTEGFRINLERDVDFLDKPTWNMIAGGQARGVHHIESPAMTSLIRQCDVRDIDCLTTIVAIIRPGAANQGKKDTFARRHQGFEPPQYAHPSLKPVLHKTYGLMVFEEHILQVATEFAGMNLGRADVLRRALNKEKMDMIRELETEFRACAEARQHPPAEIDAVWDLVENFRGFMFNKAHSAEYAVEAFEGAWLKRRWPAHYLAAILSNYRGFYASSPTLPQILYVLEARRLGAGFLLPCVNHSRERFTVEYLNALLDVERAGDSPTKPLPLEGRGWEGVSIARETPNSQSAVGRAVPAVPSCDDPVACTFDTSADSVGAARGTAKQECRQDDQTTNDSTVQPNSTTPSKPSLQGRGVDAPQPLHPPRPMIRIPVSHIHGLSQAFLGRHQEQRARGPFTSLEDFVERCRPGETEALSLLDAGALDVFHPSRPVMFWQVRRLCRRAARPGGLLFDVHGASVESKDDVAASRATPKDPAPPAAASPTDAPVTFTEPTPWQIATREMELLGFPVTIDPLTFLSRDDKQRTIDWSRYTPVADLGSHLGRRVRVCGLIVADRINRTVGGDLMKFVSLADCTGFVEAFLFPDTYERFGHLTVANPILEATALVEPFENGNGFTLRVQRVAKPVRVPPAAKPGNPAGKESLLPPS